MGNRKNQIYEEYWSYTAAWVDIHGIKFNSCLRACVHYFDNKTIINYNSSLYKDLQRAVARETGLDGASVRKGINQMVKLGFLKPLLAGYREETKDYLNAKTDRRRENILSKVVYNYSNFQNSMTCPDAGTANQMRFLIKTLEEVGHLDKRALISLMTTDINDFERGYLTKDELDWLYKNACDNEFVERKYNQLGHFLNLLKRLNDLCEHDGDIYFKADAEKFVFEEDDIKKTARDAYLQRIYKSELEEESCLHYECVTPKCMLEGLSYPVLIASHIKPYSHCKSDTKAQFDVNNGLLLSKNIDSLFDLGYITIDNNGIILTSRVLEDSVKQYMAQFRLHKDFINPKRMDYMSYHRERVFERRYRLPQVRRYVYLDNDSISIAAES